MARQKGGKKRQNTVGYTSSSGVISSTKWLGSELLPAAVEEKGPRGRRQRRENARIFARPRRASDVLLFPSKESRPRAHYNSRSVDRLLWQRKPSLAIVERRIHQPWKSVKMFRTERGICSSPRE